MMQCSRRQVIKTLFLGTAFSNVIGRSWSSPVIFDLQQSASGSPNGTIRLTLADFPELAAPRGSVRVSTSVLDPRTNKQVGLFPPVIINRGDGGELYAMSAACAHEDCVVRRLDKTSNRMVCPCHGSQYLADGTVVQGPALQSLYRYETRVDASSLWIEIPDLFFEMSAKKATGGDRLEISFLAFESLTYEIYFRPSLEAPAALVTFATSASGPLDQTEIKIPGDFATIFVERPGQFGFFQIAMKTRKV